MDISAYGPSSRWFLRHVFLAPAPLARILAGSLGAGGLALVVMAVLANQPGSSATAEDADFFVFISIFFLVLAGLAAVVAITRTLLARRRAMM